MSTEDRINRIAKSIGTKTKDEEGVKSAARRRLAPILDLLEGVDNRLKAAGSKCEVVKIREEIFMGATYIAQYFARNHRSEAIGFSVSSGPAIGDQGRIIHSISGLDQEGVQAILLKTGQDGTSAGDVIFSSPQEVEVVATEIERMLIAYLS